MTDFANMHIWSDEDATSTNPICLDDFQEDQFETMELSERKERKKSDKKKKRRRRKKSSQEDSSLADSVLSSILSEEDIGGGDDDAKLAGKHQMTTLDESVPSPQTNYHEKRAIEKQRRRERLEDLKTRRIAPKKQVQPMRTSLYPSSDEDTNGDFDRSQFSETTHTVDDDDLSKNPFSEQNRTNVVDDDLSKNPFADDSVRDRAISDSDEDIVESSKRLLRVVDQRIQYQHQSNEAHSIKAEIKQMRGQAEAMAEQLRRAVETKCDLVLAQNEMERNHEQSMIAKDGELHDLRLYIQEILEQQALSEMNLMNEISLLARTLETNKKKHTKEVEDKEAKISQLETKIKSMRVSSVRGVSSESFKDRFTKDAGKSMFVFPSYE